MRYHFNSDDTPGRYIYLRDDENGDYWSASWQPVGKDLNEYKSEVHHGTAYTKMFAEYAGIKSEAMYYVPLNKVYEVWCCKVTNTSDKPRKIAVFGYAELSNDDNYNHDQVNLQYSLCTTNTSFRKNKIYQQINLNWYKGPDGSNGKERFFGLADVYKRQRINRSALTRYVIGSFILSSCLSSVASSLSTSGNPAINVITSLLPDLQHHCFVSNVVSSLPRFPAKPHLYNVAASLSSPYILLHQPENHP